MTERAVHWRGHQFQEELQKEPFVNLIQPARCGATGNPTFGFPMKKVTCQTCIDLTALDRKIVSLRLEGETYASIRDKLDTAEYPLSVNLILKIIRSFVNEPENLP